MYGEGWNFGEVADNARFVQASQGQLGGTGIATFSDRLRDAVRGGSVWNGDPRGQGLGTGLLTGDNGSGVNGDERARGERLAWYTDLAQLGLAGNLRGFRFGSNCRHTILRGAELEFGGHPAAYAEAPDEVISYVDAHDNETLFDALTLKLHPATPMVARVRMNTVCLALATLGQSPVMWHAGTDILRSKSLDRNSDNSGDWFNYLDFTMTDNGFASGLPPEHDNGDKWHVLAPLLADPRLKPTPADIRAAARAGAGPVAAARLEPAVPVGQRRPGAGESHVPGGEQLAPVARRGRDGHRRPDVAGRRPVVRRPGGLQLHAVAGAPDAAARPHRLFPAPGPGRRCGSLGPPGRGRQRLDHRAGADGGGSRPPALNDPRPASRGCPDETTPAVDGAAGLRTRSP